MCACSSTAGNMPVKPLHPRSNLKYRVQALVPRPAGRARNVWTIRNGSTEFQGVLLEDYSSSSQCGDSEVEAARYVALGETGFFFPLGGERFPGNVHLSPFPSRFKRQEKNLRMVQL